MFDYAAARRHMIDNQIRTNDVTDPVVLAAFRQVPRETFTPVGRRSVSYSDVHVPLGEGRVMIRPRDFAKMISAADIQPTDVVLDIACGRGYSSAVIAGIAETVIGLEDEEVRVEQASDLLTSVDITNAAIVMGDLKSGAREHGPFNVIFVNGSVSEVPKTWLDQLANGGRLVCVVQNGPIGRVYVYTRSGDVIGERVDFDASVPALPGFERADEFVF
jgi:protein-L-isoaspartate(D-aspartate) O-methyltransferase